MTKPRIYKDGSWKWTVRLGPRAIDRYHGFVTWKRSLDFALWAIGQRD
jgi:hypothetical protein